jgi:hypothetical protein
MDGRRLLSRTGNARRETLIKEKERSTMYVVRALFGAGHWSRD